MATTEICGFSGLPFAMVTCLHQRNVYIKRKLRILRVQKFIPLVGVKPAFTCAGLQTTPFDLRRYRPENGNSGLPFAMVPCLHQRNVYIKIKLRVWRVQNCIPLVSANTALICAGLQTTPSHVMRYSPENGNLWKFGSTFRHGTVFIPKQCLIKSKLRVWRVQICIPLVGEKTALSCAGLQTTPSDVRRYKSENGNSGLLFAVVPCLHQSNVLIKRKLWVWKGQKCIPLVSTKTALTCAGLQTTPSHVRQNRAENGKFVTSGIPFTMVPCLQQSNVQIKWKLRVWRVEKCIPRVCAKTTLNCVGPQTTPLM